MGGRLGLGLSGEHALSICHEVSKHRLIREKVDQTKSLNSLFLSRFLNILIWSLSLDKRTVSRKEPSRRQWRRVK